MAADPSISIYLLVYTGTLGVAAALAILQLAIGASLLVLVGLSSLTMWGAGHIRQSRNRSDTNGRPISSQELTVRDSRQDPLREIDTEHASIPLPQPTA